MDFIVYMMDNIVNQAAKTRYMFGGKGQVPVTVILVNDAHKTSGFIGEISAIISESDTFDYLNHTIVRLAGEDVPIPYNHALETAMVPSVEKIAEAIRKIKDKQ